MFSGVFHFLEDITLCARDKAITPLLKLTLIAFVRQYFRLFQNTFKIQLENHLVPEFYWFLAILSA